LSIADRVLSLHGLRRFGLVRRCERVFKRFWRPGPIASLRGRFRIELGRLQQEVDARGAFVLLGSIAWDHPLFQRPQQLARAFSRLGYLVFYCEPPWYIRARPGIRQVEPNLLVCRIPFSAFRALTGYALYLSLATDRRKLPQFSRAPVVYDVIDELEVFDSSDQKALAFDHGRLVREADLVVASSDRLAAGVQALRPDALLCPNGVDHRFFFRCLTEVLPVPADLDRLPGAALPTAGFYGALARWVDYPLLASVARACPGWRFVLIGPDLDGSLAASTVLREANIHWLGPKHYTLLPNYLQRLDVMLVPFLVNSVTLSASPIKLLEYLAAGKPVVSVDLPECRKFQGVLIARDAAEFSAMLAAARRAADAPGYRETLSQSVLSADWNVRAQLIIAALDSQPTKL
jgi:teichuronic acid biosynthesis glycosyltransferase TuaH